MLETQFSFLFELTIILSYITTRLFFYLSPFYDGRFFDAAVLTCTTKKVIRNFVIIFGLSVQVYLNPLTPHACTKN